jgi:hypothetical protein
MFDRLKLSSFAVGGLGDYCGLVRSTSRPAIRVYKFICSGAHINTSWQWQGIRDVSIDVVVSVMCRFAYRCD